MTTNGVHGRVRTPHELLSLRDALCPGPQGLAFLGLGVSRVWTIVFFLLLAERVRVGVGTMPLSLDLSWAVFFLCGAVFSFAVALSADHVRTLLGRIGIPFVAVFGGVAAVLLVCSLIFAEHAAAIGLAAAVFGGLTLALLRVEWGCVYGRLENHAAGLYVFLSFFAAFAVVIVLRLLPALVSGVVLAALPAVAVVSLRCARRALDDIQADAYASCPQADALPPGASKAAALARGASAKGLQFRAFAPLAFGMFAFVFATATIKSMCDPVFAGAWDASWQTTLIDGLVALLFFVLYVVLRDMDVLLVYRWVLPLIAVGYTLFPLLPGSHGAVGYLLAAAGYGLFDLLTWIVMAKYVHDGRADGLRVFGFGVGATLLGRACGSVFGTVLAGLQTLGTVSLSSVSLVMVVFLVLVCVAVLPERSLERLVKESASDTTSDAAEGAAGGASGSPSTALSSGLTEERLARCCELASAHGLTPREAEVMVLLVRGRNAQVVARELSIAVGTVQAHTKHVYGKLGVHNQQELIDLVEDGGARG